GATALPASPGPGWFMPLRGGGCPRGWKTIFPKPLSQKRFGIHIRFPRPEEKRMGAAGNEPGSQACTGAPGRPRREWLLLSNSHQGGERVRFSFAFLASLRATLLRAKTPRTQRRGWRQSNRTFRARANERRPGAIDVVPCGRHHLPLRSRRCRLANRGRKQKRPPDERGPKPIRSTATNSRHPLV